MTIVHERAGRLRGGKDRSLTIRLKRAYEPPSRDDAARVLVDRVWPRGVTKEKIEIVAWLPDLGPSTALRKWFGHDPAKWPAFYERYRRELAEKGPLLRRLASLARNGTLTLVYSARDTEHNQAVVIREVLGHRRIR